MPTWMQLLVYAFVILTVAAILCCWWLIQCERRAQAAECSDEAQAFSAMDERIAHLVKPFPGELP